jgi:hypothetical protein
MKRMCSYLRMIFAENRRPLFGIMRYTFFRTVSPKIPDGMNHSTASTTT